MDGVWGLFIDILQFMGLSDLRLVRVIFKDKRYFYRIRMGFDILIPIGPIPL